MWRNIVLLAGTLWVLWQADIHVAPDGSLTMRDWKAERVFDTKHECDLHRLLAQTTAGYVSCLPEGKHPTDLRPEWREKK
jgi:hypothetical protein